MSDEPLDSCNRIGRFARFYGVNYCGDCFREYSTAYAPSTSIVRFALFLGPRGIKSRAHEYAAPSTDSRALALLTVPAFPLACPTGFQFPAAKRFTRRACAGFDGAW